MQTAQPTTVVVETPAPSPAPNQTSTPQPTAAPVTAEPTAVSCHIFLSG
jgi:hypothetical protein